jgi:hypothetical protein
LEWFKLGRPHVKTQIPFCFERLFDGQERQQVMSRLPEAGYFFQSGSGFPVGYSPSNDGHRPFHNLSREFLTESAREQKRELFVLSLIVLASAWPVISMVVTVVQLICTRHPQFR